MRKWLLGGAAVVVVALLAVGAAWYLHVKLAGRDIHGSSTVEFVPTPPPPKPKEPGVVWPMYGHDPPRLRAAGGGSPPPPFRPPSALRAPGAPCVPRAVGDRGR